MAAKTRVPRAFYRLTFVLLAVVVALAVLPLIWGPARRIYEPDHLRVVLGLLSLFVAMVLFGLIGDSEALVKSSSVNGLYVQLGGASAAFAVFFFLLSSGLSPHNQLTVYLTKADGSLMQPGDGAIEVTLAGNVRRTADSISGQVAFAYLPKSEEHRLFLRPAPWRIDAVTPEECARESTTIVGGCTKVFLRVSRHATCLDKASMLFSESAPIETTLDTVYRRMREGAQRAVPDTPVDLRLSGRLLESGLHNKKFTLERKDETARRLCSHAADVANWFNRSQNKILVKAFVDCNSISVQLAEEPEPKEYDKCVN